MLVKSAASAQKVAEAQVQFFIVSVRLAPWQTLPGLPQNSILNLQTWTANLKPSPKSYVTQYVDIHCSQ